jgi:hypothetical protein
MISSVIKIIDRIIQLLTIRKTNRRTLFVDHIEPLYIEMADIHKDYLNACRELTNFIKDLKDDELSTDEIQRIIKKYKTVLEPQRVKAFTLAKSVKDKKLRRKLPKEAMEFYDFCFYYFYSTSGEFSLNPYKKIKAFQRYSGFYSSINGFLVNLLLENYSIKKNEILDFIIDNERLLTDSWSNLMEIYANLRITFLR